MITVGAMGLILPIVTVLVSNNPSRRPIILDEAAPEIEAPSASSSANN